MYAHMNRCRPSGGRPTIRVATQFAIATKMIAIDHRTYQMISGIIRMIRNATVQRFRCRSSSTASWTGCCAGWSTVTSLMVCLPLLVAERIGRTMLLRMALDKETAERIDQPVAEEAEREVRLTPT